ncbi:unnamed protein product [Prorocentrum cordatum]|uniref:Uncharacterized protein n=1 Tax=Prorocentrum cordatum TaxID=2364126 RepID=A0ABN9PME8_9DINO|nr:unnamed protein product [Polarella glacialis]
MQVINTPFEASQVPPLFAGIFNSLGIWPLLYAAVLLPGAAGQSTIPAAPFCAGSFFLGAFALSPYLALREYRGKPGDHRRKRDWPTRNVLESRWNAVLALAGTAYLALYALGNGTIGAVAPEAAWAGFLPLFTQSLTAHVSSVDFMVLWMFFPPVLLEDGRRRGRFAGPPGEWASAEKALFAFCAAVPVVGGGVWLLLRPELAQGGEE